VALARFGRGDLDEAARSASQAIDAGAAAFGMRSRIYAMAGEVALAVLDAKRVLDVREADLVDVRFAVQLLRRQEPTALATVAVSRAVVGLDPHMQLHILDELLWEGTVAYAVDLVERLLAESQQVTWRQPHAFNYLVLSLIALGRFGDAMRVIGDPRERLSRADEGDCFNFAMAEWGISGELPLELLKAVVERSAEADGAKRGDANYAQCLAVANWATGDSAAARQWVERARRSAMLSGPRIFSAWRYLNVQRGEFRDDLQDLLRLIEGESLKPRFLVGTGQQAALGFGEKPPPPN
jgi:hypothetical protein